MVFDELLRLPIGQLLGKEKVIVTQWGRVCWFSLVGYLLQTVLFSALNIDIVIRFPLLTVTRRDDNRKDLRTLTCGLPGGLQLVNYWQKEGNSHCSGAVYAGLLMD